MFVQNFKILGAVQPEKSLRKIGEKEKWLKKGHARTHARTHTHRVTEKTKIIYPLYNSYGDGGFVCVEVLQPSQPNGVMSSTVSIPNHTFTGQALSSKQLTSFVHILLPETDNCPSWISRNERMTVENVAWSSTKECCRPRRGLNPRSPGFQSDSASNWATEAGWWWWW